MMRWWTVRSLWLDDCKAYATLSLIALVAFTLAVIHHQPAFAQAEDSPWNIDLSVDPRATPGSDNTDGTTVVPGSDASSDAPAPTPAPPQSGEAGQDGPAGRGEVKLVAQLTDAGQKIEKGIIWRVFEERKAPEPHNKLIKTVKSSAPLIRLAEGEYIVNAAFGRAHLTRKISVVAGKPAVEKFVLNAGGLRVRALVGEAKAPPATVSYTILEGVPDQSGNRAVVMSGAKPDLIIRLNSGIYHIISTYGDANATIGTDVTVEAGKLTEATISHAAATITLRLVARTGGEALPGTRWTIKTQQGEVVKRSVGALPTHILAPGTYQVVAQLSGKSFAREIIVADGDKFSVEVTAAP